MVFFYAGFVSLHGTSWTTSLCHYKLSRCLCHKCPFSSREQKKWRFEDDNNVYLTVAWIMVVSLLMILHIGFCRWYGYIIVDFHYCYSPQTPWLDFFVGTYYSFALSFHCIFLKCGLLLSSNSLTHGYVNAQNAKIIYYYVLHHLCIDLALLRSCLNKSLR